MEQATMKYRLLCVLGLCAGLAIVGCGKKGPATSNVTGKVTLASGQPLPGGRIDFRSAASGDLVSGQIKADGTYEVLSVPPGEYKVGIVNGHLQGTSATPPGLEPMPGAAENAGKKYVPIHPGYSKVETSGLSTTVEGRTNTYDISLR